MILRCSKRTVDFHINNLKNKLNAFSRAQAVAIGLQYGIIDF
jgi:DNA-binding CsgD family transcriptional regulator